ncbi:CGNR zinc finger domain-containing protein [Cryptosporangium phraense]|uniref:Zinc finger CGNR domain-containing protein n=1 Tax=Cryptosporangium phraense TaxID=2593070 RepID=A0A545AJ61_9ACTN|nr:CGNR zinc finger domain-containing protein [Cryptosporangium phraense]TQS41364.1 hypothetical protein FL583_30135 [Cryptosporangium phraense]
MKVVEEFLNTVDERSFSRHGEIHVPGDRLTSPEVLSDWLAAHGLEPSDDLTAARDLRTALRRAVAGDADALANYPLRLRPDPEGQLRTTGDTGSPWMDEILRTVAESVARGDWKRLKLCAAPDCRWAFYDNSRNGFGRWCGMESCGNRHKTRNYRARQASA